MKTLEEFMEFSRQAAPYTAANYPALGSLQGKAAFVFMLTHSMRHMSKTAGRIETILESFDHGNIHALNADKIEKLITKQLFNALRLTALVTLSAEQIEARFKQDFPLRS